MNVRDSLENLEKLEAIIAKVTDLLRRTQAERRSLLEQLTKVRADLDKQAKSSQGLEREVLALRREREEVRSRIERLLRQIEDLTKSEPGA
jgi:FtsZ-binding cell division protein ZapB